MSILTTRGYCLDFVCTQYPQSCLPLVIQEWIVTIVQIIRSTWDEMAVLNIGTRQYRRHRQHARQS